MASTIDFGGEGPHLVEGPAGSIEMIVDPPRGEPRGAVIVAHPHPLLGGHARHELPAGMLPGMRALRLGHLNGADAPS